MPGRFDDYERMLSGSPIWRRRLQGIGHIGGDEAIAWGVTGPMMRGSGVNQWDEYGTTTWAELDDRVNRAVEALRGLGLAARLFPPIRESLREKRPESCTLTVDEAYGFLREVGPLLERSGFGVLVPPWWNKPRIYWPGSRS